MTQSPGSGPPLFPGAPGDPSADLSSQVPGGPPREAKVVVVVLTALAAVLVFFGVLYIAMTSQLQQDLRAAMDSVEQGDRISDGMLRLTIRLAGVLQAALGLVIGLAAQGVRGRRRWARPLAYTSAGVVVVLGLLSLVAGVVNIPLVILTGLAAMAIYLLSKPPMRRYLSSKPRP